MRPLGLRHDLARRTIHHVLMSRLQLRLLLVVLLATSCAEAPDPEATVASPAATSSDPSCSGPGMGTAKRYGRVDAIAASYPSTASEIARYDEEGSGSDGPSLVDSPLRSRRPDEHVSLCYYDGEFNVSIPGPPAQAGTSHRKFPQTRLSLLVFEDGSTEFRAVGDRERFDATGPRTR